MLLDERIQPNLIQQIGEVIRLLRGRGGMAIVLVEQFVGFAFDLADRFYVLKRGQVTLSGARGEVGRAALLAAVSV